jgi:hypothetical protein
MTHVLNMFSLWAVRNYIHMRNVSETPKFRRENSLIQIGPHFFELVVFLLVKGTKMLGGWELSLLERFVQHLKKIRTLDFLFGIWLGNAIRSQTLFFAVDWFCLGCLYHDWRVSF